MITNHCSPGIFTVEMCAKIFAMGFICHENSYLRYCHLSMLVCSIRIVPQGKLQLVLILAIMSLGRVILYYLILNVHKPYQFQTTPNTFTITRMDIGGSICHLVNLSIFMFLKQLQYFSKKSSWYVHTVRSIKKMRISNMSKYQYLSNRAEINTLIFRNAWNIMDFIVVTSG